MKKQLTNNDIPSELPEDRLEGKNPILEALKVGRPVDKIWIAKRQGRPDQGLAHLLQLARESNAVVLEVDRNVLDQMAVTHNHQGVIAQVAAHAYWEINDLLEQSFQKTKQPFFLVLAELKDSYNLGSILRIADAAGVHGIIIPQRRSISLNAAVAKASSGAIEYVPVTRVNNLTQTLLTLKDKGFWIFGTDAGGDMNYQKADWTGPIAVVIGSEGEGLGPSIRKHCDFLISIPMCGQVNSLNAAVAAGIIVFEAAGQRQQREQNTASKGNNGNGSGRNE